MGFFGSGQALLKLFPSLLEQGTISLTFMMRRKMDILRCVLMKSEPRLTKARVAYFTDGVPVNY